MTLIDRLSKLEGPDREADWEIKQFFMGEWLHKHGYKREGDYYRTATPPISGAKICSGPEYYTASVDAAISLAERVLPGWKRQLLEGFNGKWIARVCSQRRELFSTDYLRETEFGGSPNAAIALCIAILRAKEASKP